MMAVNIMCGLGVISCILVILAAILSLIDFKGVPTFILSVYLVILGLLAFIAEMRIFRAIRGLIFNLVRYFYFLTGCIGRGIFYFFIGSISFEDDKPVSWVACSVSCMTGVLLIALDLKFKFPVYIDPQVAKMQAEARLKWERDEAERKLISATSTPRAAMDERDMSMNSVRGDVARGDTRSEAPLKYSYDPPRI
jgi:hypothetical protein